MARYGKRLSPRWWTNEPTRLIFERRALEFFPDLHFTVTSEACTYSTVVDVPFYEARRVKLIFNLGRSRNAPYIVADGPRESPHRYREYDSQSLCVWDPLDPPEARWLFDDGLLELLAIFESTCSKKLGGATPASGPAPKRCILLASPTRRRQHE
jgi:hypothetical protein